MDVSFLIILILIKLVLITGTNSIMRTDVTVSGISSGGSMATQLHIAFSDEVSGCGILAGPPYYCAANLMAATMCMSGPITSISVLGILKKIQSYEKLRSVDNVTNIRNDPVYIFTGKYDTVALPGIVKLNEQIYSSMGANVKTNYQMAATHGFPTDNYGLSCLVLNLNSYINNCQFNMAYNMLNHLYGGNLIEPRFGTRTPLIGQFLSFDQKAFMSPPAMLNGKKSLDASLLKWLSQSIHLYKGTHWHWPTSGLMNWTLDKENDSFNIRDFTTKVLSSSFDREGFIYFSSACAKGKICPIHVALHGCQQGKYYVGDTFATRAGYLEVAELNDLIVIFPQVAPSLMFPTNPMGCWDWWGYSSLSYATKSAPQMLGIKKIIDTVRSINKAMAA